MSIEQEKMIVEALPSLYPLQEFEEKAIHKVIDALPSEERQVDSRPKRRIYHDSFGRAYYRQFVVVTDIDGLMVSGIFDDYDKAVGHVMVNLWEFSESYKEEGDWFKIGEPEYYDEGMHITIKFQSHHWEKPCEETYFILDYDTRKPELDKTKESKEVTE